MLTELATSAGGGDHRAVDELFAALYAELRELAGRILKHQNSGHTLQPTALVHEAYVKLVDASRMDARCAAHFRALAAKAMGQILVDHARAKHRQKRGGGDEPWRRVTLDDVFDHGGEPTPGDADLLTLHDTLMEMRQLDERLARVVELKLLGGLTTLEVAEVLDVSKRSVERDWAMGKAWLRRNLSDEPGPDANDGCRT